MKHLVRCCLMTAAIFCASPLAARSSFEFLNTQGPHSVGLKVVEQRDRSRIFPSGAVSKSSARPIQTLVWYPAEKGGVRAMTVGDYASVADTELRFGTPDAAGNKWRVQLKASVDETMHAVRDARPDKSRYPVVIYAPSDSSISWENADLCEYLASHGYVVIASASMGASTRDMTDDLAGIDTQARDISFLISYAATLSDVDMKYVAVASWSWGGISSLFAAARDPRIKALVALDGSMRYFPGLVKKAGDVHPDRMTIPLMFFTAEYPNYLEDIERYQDGPAENLVGPNVLNAWNHGDLVTVNMIGMSHGEFSSMFRRRKSPERFAEDQVADYGPEDANQGYAWVARYSLAFLDAYLKHDASAIAFLKATPAGNGVPKHVMAIQSRAAQPTP